MAHRVTVVKYAPILLDSARKEFPSLLLLADSEESARNNGVAARAQEFTGAVARVEWETERPDRVDAYG